MSKFRKIVAVCALISLLSTLVIGASPLVQAQASDELVRPVYGDGDYDQKAAAGDALLVLQLSVSNASYELNPAIPTAAETRKDMPFLYLLDVNGDFTIDAADALLILQHSVGLIGSFPVEHSGVYEVYYEEDMANYTAFEKEIPIDPTNFPDEAFRTLVETYDIDENGRLSEEERLRVTEIESGKMGSVVRSLKGIEYFSELRALACVGRGLTELDLTQNTKLVELDCSNNALETLDVSQNKELKILNCSSNQLRALDVSHNAALEQLRCTGNKIRALDLSQNDQLIVVTCDEDVAVTGWEMPVEVVEINEANFPDDVFRRDVEKLDLDQNGWLSDREIDRVTEIDVTRYTVSVPEVDLEVRPKIDSLKGIEYFTQLEVLLCTGNNLTSLDISTNSKLERLDCGDNKLTVLDVQHNPALYRLDCSVNQLQELNLQNNPQLQGLSCSHNNLKELNLSNNTALETLECYNNQLTELDLTNNPLIYHLMCDEDVTVIGRKIPVEVVEINEANFPDDVFRRDVKGFDLDQNGWLSDQEIAQVTEIDVSRYDMWAPEIDPPCREMIASLKGVEYFTQLKSLRCYNNSLTTLDVSRNIKLETLDCSRNQLTELDIRNNAALDQLNCGMNELTELDCSHNLKLRALTCIKNSISTLDLTNNPSLSYLLCDEDVAVIGGEAPAEVVEINETNFPDDVFRRDVEEFDLNQNGWLSDKEIAQVTHIDVSALPPVTAEYPPAPSRTKIKTLQGIEYFTSLEYLDCNGNALVALDLRYNTALTTLWCAENSLEKLDLTQNPHLKSLYCMGNRLTTLDVTHNRALTELFCGQNGLSELNVSDNPDLKSLSCSDNSLTSLSLHQNTVLTYLECEDNEINSLDLSQNTLLLTLKCLDNNLTVLDLTRNTALNQVECDEDVAVTGWEAPVEVVEINETNFPDCVFRRDVEEFDLDQNGWLSDKEIAQVTHIDVSALPPIIDVYPPAPSRPKINTLQGIEYFTELERLNCSGNNLKTLDISQNTALVALACGKNCLETLDVTHNTALNYLGCYSNSLTDLDITQNRRLEELSCSGNKLERLDVTQNSDLIILNCSENLLAELDISNNRVLQQLFCDSNRLTTLDVSMNSDLQALSCNHNQLSSLSLHQNTMLTLLRCEGNGIGTLDLSQNTLLWALECSDNQLLELNLTKNTALSYVKCDEDVNVIGFER